jgi:hypothetical protein
LNKRDLPALLLCGLIGLGLAVALIALTDPADPVWRSTLYPVLGGWGFLIGSGLFAAITSYVRADSFGRREAHSNICGLIGALCAVVIGIQHDVQGWPRVAVVFAGSVGGLAAYALWRRRPGGPEASLEKLTNPATVMQAYVALKPGDRRREYQAVKALQRMTADGIADRPEMAAFAKSEITRAVRLPMPDFARNTTYHSVYDGPTTDLIELLAIAAPDDEEAFLTSLLGTPGDRSVRARLADFRREPLTMRDAEYVREALLRFEAVGLIIKPDLDRELIVTRALIDADDWRYVPGDPPEVGFRIAKDPIAELFSFLVRESDVFSDRRGFQMYRREPELLQDRRRSAANHLHLADHEQTVFSNAAYLTAPHHAESNASDHHDFANQLCLLSGGAVSISADAWDGPRLTVRAGGMPFSATVKYVTDNDPYASLFDSAAHHIDHRYLSIHIDEDGYVAVFVAADLADVFVGLVALSPHSVA